MDQNQTRLEKAAAIFGVSVERMRAQYETNLAQLRRMHAKAVATGKRVNNYTAEQLAHHVRRFEEIISGAL